MSRRAPAAPACPCGSGAPLAGCCGRFLQGAEDAPFDAGAKWLGLEVRRHQPTGPDSAEVEFVARWRVGGRAVRLHERSRFVREGERWYYVDGDQF